MKLTERDKEQLRIAIRVAFGGQVGSPREWDILGWDWYKPDDDEIREKCRDILYDLIVKAGEPEPVTTSHTDII